MKPKYDMLWKGVVEDLMVDLLLFVDPDIGKEVDLERGFSGEKWQKISCTHVRVLRAAA